MVGLDFLGCCWKVFWWVDKILIVDYMEMIGWLKFG